VILPLGECVMRRACEQSCEWQRIGLPSVPVSVNLSARQFTDNIADTVGRILAQTGPGSWRCWRKTAATRSRDNFSRPADAQSCARMLGEGRALQVSGLLRQPAARARRLRRVTRPAA
jgi:hypothetical protein